MKSFLNSSQCNLFQVIIVTTFVHILELLASERSERAQSCSCSIEISDTSVNICI